VDGDAIMFLSAKELGVAKQFTNTLHSATIRSFDGGLNVVDTDLNMKPKFAVVLDNFERGIDGTLSLRPGTKLLATLASASGIVNSYYFNGYIVAVTDDGTVWKINGDGTNAPLLAGGVNPWLGATSSVSFVSFAVFNSDLIICCGVHKPLIIPGNPNNLLYNKLGYLVDLAALSNVNTPVGLFVIAHNQYTVIAGSPAQPSFIFVSCKGTSGTYVGDGAPNDSIAIDLGQRVSLGSSAVTGMVSYRDKLIVTFERGVLPVNLGVYTGTPAVHTPTDDGFIAEFGCIAHRSLVSVGDDTYFCDNIGVNSVQRIILNNSLRPSRASAFIDPLITAAMQSLTTSQISQYVFAIYDMRHRRYMLFVPVFVAGVLTETVVFSYTSVPTLKVEAWARLRGWIFSSGCRTSLQNIVFNYGNKMYSYDFDNLTANADYIGDTSKNADGTGIPINFTWELPWGDLGKRMNVKQTRYISLDTTGTGSFQLKMYVDNIRMDSGGNDSPLLTTDMQGGSVGGYGLQHYGDTPYGGGRPTGDERLFAWPAKFKINKLQITGSTKKPLRFVSISFAYEAGGFRR
jgi:hypothetical protein